VVFEQSDFQHLPGPRGARWIAWIPHRRRAGPGGGPRPGPGGGRGDAAALKRDGGQGVAPNIPLIARGGGGGGNGVRGSLGPKRVAEKNPDGGKKNGLFQDLGPEFLCVVGGPKTGVPCPGAAAAGKHISFGATYKLLRAGRARGFIQKKTGRPQKKFHFPERKFRRMAKKKK